MLYFWWGCRGNLKLISLRSRGTSSVVFVLREFHNFTCNGSLVFYLIILYYVKSIYLSYVLHHYQISPYCLYCCLRRRLGKFVSTDLVPIRASGSGISAVSLLGVKCKLLKILIASPSWRNQQPLAKMRTYIFPRESWPPRVAFLSLVKSKNWSNIAHRPPMNQQLLLD